MNLTLFLKVATTELLVGNFMAPVYNMPAKTHSLTQQLPWYTPTPGYTHPLGWACDRCDPRARRVRAIPVVARALSLACSARAPF